MKKLNKSAEDLSKKDRFALAVKLNLGTPEDLVKLGAKELLAVIIAWEKTQLEKSEGASEGASAEPWAMGYHNGKKIMSRVPVELNGKNYEDILVEGGETFRV